MTSNVRVHGSMKRKIVATELIEERTKCNFNKEELSKLWGDPSYLDDKAYKDVLEDPNMA